MRRPRTALTLAGVAGAMCVVSVAAKTANGDPWLATSLTAVTGVLFVVSGLAADHRWTGNPTGALMVLVAVALFVEDVQLVPLDAVSTIGNLLADCSTPALGWLLVAYPSGRAESRTARSLVVCGWVAAIGLRLARAPFEDTRYRGEGRRNLLYQAENPDIRAVLEVTTGASGLLLAGALVVVLTHRWTRASHPARRVLAPVYATGVVCGACALAAAVSVALAPGLEQPRVGYRALVTAYQIAFALMPLAFLGGLTRQRLRVAPIEATLLGLTTTSTVRSVEESLQRTVRDPTLRVHLARPGTPVPARPGTTPVLHGGRLVAHLTHDPAVIEDVRLWRAAVSAAALAIHGQQLAEAGVRRAHELQATAARLVEAGDRARLQVERDLHDGAQQHLVAAAYRLKEVQAALADSGASLDPRPLALAVEALESAIGDLRSLTRGLRPAILVDEGLGPAIEQLARTCPVPVRHSCEVGRLAPEAEATLYFAAAEALTNVVKHAGATGVCLTVAMEGPAVVLTVEDDGHGWLRAERRAGTGARELGHGLAGLADRVRALGGELELGPSARGGTAFLARVPHG